MEIIKLHCTDRAGVFLQGELRAKLNKQKYILFTQKKISHQYNYYYELYDILYLFIFNLCTAMLNSQQR